jgi:hypothetical protein
VPNKIAAIKKKLLRFPVISSAARNYGKTCHFTGGWGQKPCAKQNGLASKLLVNPHSLCLFGVTK